MAQAENRDRSCTLKFIKYMHEIYLFAVYTCLYVHSCLAVPREAECWETRKDVSEQIRRPRRRHKPSYRGVANSSCLLNEQLITNQWHPSTSLQVPVLRQADTSAARLQLLVSFSSHI